MEIKPTYEELQRKIERLETLLSECNCCRCGLKECRLSATPPIVALPIPIFLKDVRGRYLGCNQAFTDIMGTSSEQIEGKTAHELWPSEYADIYHEKDIELMRAGGYQIYEAAVRDKNGIDRAVIFCKGVLKDHRGDTSGLVGTFVDISSHKALELKLRASDERFKAVLEHSLDAIYRCNLKSGRYDYVSPAIERILGFTPREIAQMPMEESISRVHPDDIEDLQTEMARAEAVGKAELEFRFRAKDGGYRWLADSFFYLYDDRHRPLYRDGIVRGITERKLTEEALKQSRRRFVAMIQAVPSITFEGDADGNNIFASEQWYAYTGMVQGETTGTGWTHAIHPEDMPLVLDAFERSKREGSMFYSKIRLRARDGSYRWFIARSVPVRSVGGKIIRWMGSLTDIDDMVKAELALRSREAELQKLNAELEQRVAERTAELERRNREIRELAHQTIEAMENDRRVLSKELHDSIGGTLAALMYQIQSRLDGMQRDPPGACMPFEKILAHLQDTIRETRYISKKLRPSVLDDFGLIAAVRDHIHDLRDFYPHMRFDDDIRVSEEEVGKDLKTVVYRVIQEALNNAGKHSRAAVVKISIFKRNDRLHLRISDNGRGFDVARTLAEPFSGYGIQNMKERVEICQGSFRVKSEPGKGARVAVSLPLHDAGSASA